MNKKFSFPVKISLILFGLLVIGTVAYIAPIATVFLWADAMHREISRNEEYMQQPEVYESVGRTLVLYSQSDPKLFPEGEIDSAWLPAELHHIGGAFYEFDSSGSRIEMGGGFYHYGYSLVLDKQTSTSNPNVWNFSFYSEGSSTKLLETFSLPASETISAEVLSLFCHFPSILNKGIKRKNSGS
ncbi:MULTISPECIES: hypothetical protein [unclassified Coleofasciculus]|uniref:hypothetical protein n=1 Tax=unclassified Coleofasciculus TaxID=2692782 RepID=UPI00187FAE42|nr:MULTISPECIES: hypothetical protein [unclassified Coleofasciculus]MBE9129010.1 hypothetical protein [Coleofasciculus sp. LEGE 07081]MBE9151589.1 hypothetical protein [Coleofasciculus sp. LEGE 07092]